MVTESTSLTHIYVQNVVQHVELLKAKHPGLPVFIIGESIVCDSCIHLHQVYMYNEAREGILLR